MRSREDIMKSPYYSFEEKTNTTKWLEEKKKKTHTHKVIQYNKKEARALSFIFIFSKIKR